MERHGLQSVVAGLADQGENVLAGKIRVAIVDETVIIGIDVRFLRAEDFRLRHADRKIRDPDGIAFLEKLRLGGILVDSRHADSVVRSHDAVLEHVNQRLQILFLGGIKCGGCFEVRQIGVVFDGLATVVETIVADEAVFVAFRIVADLAVAAIVVGGDFRSGQGLGPEAELVDIAESAALADERLAEDIDFQCGD